MKDWFINIVWNNPTSDVYLIIFGIVVATIYTLLGDIVTSFMVDNDSSPVEKGLVKGLGTLLWPFILILYPIFILHENIKKKILKRFEGEKN